MKEFKTKHIYFNDILNNVLGDLYNGFVFSQHQYYERSKLLSDLRWVHDDKKVRVSRWPQRLRAIARKYNLEIPEFLK